MSARTARSAGRPGSSRRLTSAQLEEQLVKKRQAEYERLNFWNNNSTYFRAWSFNTAQYSNWTSNEFYNSRTEDLKKMEMKKLKETLLLERRKKLKQLLDEEGKLYEKELKSMKKGGLSFDDLKAANIEILLREEEKRRRDRDLKMYHHWRQSQPILRDFESKQHHDFVKKSWIQQVLEKRKEREAEERKAMEHIMNLKKMQEEHEKMEKEIQEERRKNEEELKLFLEKQIEMIKCKEEQEIILKKEEGFTLKAQAELDELLEERQKLEDRRKRKDLSLFHKRQYLLLLKKRSQEVKDNLDFDRRFLERIAQDEEKFLKERTERSEKIKRELQLAREAFRKQADVEMLKAKQCEFLFEEEAKKMFEKKEEEWRREEEARNKLMQEVLKMLKVQIQEKLLGNLRAQEETRKCREDLILKMEEANKELVQYQAKTKNMNCWKKDLDHQILEKRLQIFRQKKQLEEDKENELRAKKEEEEKLFKELSKMNILGYQPKANGRRQLLPM